MQRPSVEERLTRPELARREEAVRDAMAERHLDALLIAGSGPFLKLGHLRYLTNWSQPLFEEYYLFPLDGKPIYLSRYSHGANLQSKLLGLNARYPEYGAGLSSSTGRSVGAMLGNIPPAFVAAAIRESGVRSLGLCGPETMSGDFYVALTDELTRLDLKFETASDLLWTLRMIKSAEEQEWLRGSAAVGSIGFETFKRVMTIGKREYEVLSEVDRAQQLAGAETSFYMVGTGWEPILKFIDMADGVYSPGDLACFNTETAVGGYYTQVIRTVSIGEPDPDVRAAYAAVLQVQEAGAQHLRPGNRACDVFDAVREEAERRGYDITNHHPGHGQGLDVFEPPLISPHDTTVLKSGMMITLHPGLMTRSGRKVWTGDSYLIHESRTEQLSASSEEITVIPVP